MCKKKPERKKHTENGKTFGRCDCFRNVGDAFGKSRRTELYGDVRSPNTLSNVRRNALEYRFSRPSPAAIAVAVSRWRSNGIKKKKKTVTVCFQYYYAQFIALRYLCTYKSAVLFIFIFPRPVRSTFSYVIIFLEHLVNCRRRQSNSTHTHHYPFISFVYTIDVLDMYKCVPFIALFNMFSNTVLYV